MQLNYCCLFLDRNDNRFSISIFSTFDCDNRILQ